MIYNDTFSFLQKLQIIPLKLFFAAMETLFLLKGHKYNRPFSNDANNLQTYDFLLLK